MLKILFKSNDTFRRRARSITKRKKGKQPKNALNTITYVIKLQKISGQQQKVKFNFTFCCLLQMINQDYFPVS